MLYHSCGQIRAFIPDLIALGVDVLESDPADRARDGARAAEGRFRRATLLPRRHRHAAPAAARHARAKSAARSAATARPSAAAAATSSPPPTTSSPTCRRKTSWRSIRPSDSRRLGGTSLSPSEGRGLPMARHVHRFGWRGPQPLCPDGNRQRGRHSTNSGTTSVGMTPARWPSARSRATAWRPTGPKSCVHWLTYISTN